jgi:hypothetical protein
MAARVHQSNCRFSSLCVAAHDPRTGNAGYWPFKRQVARGYGHLVEAFRRGLREAGFVEGQNVMVEYRWALGQHDRLPGLAADLVRKSVAVLVSTGGESAALAAKHETSTIPIAFIIDSDPIKQLKPKRHWDNHPQHHVVAQTA